MSQQYRVCTSSTPEGLSKAVEKLLNEGDYYLQGGVSVGVLQVSWTPQEAMYVERYAQALYRVAISEHAQNLVEQEAMA